MAKFDIPRFKYLCQDYDGDVSLCVDKPRHLRNGLYWHSDQFIYIKTGRKAINDNFQDTLIELDVDDYEFDDGILRRIEK